MPSPVRPARLPGRYGLPEPLTSQSLRGLERTAPRSRKSSLSNSNSSIASSLYKPLPPIPPSKTLPTPAPATRSRPSTTYSLKVQEDIIQSYLDMEPLSTSSSPGPFSYKDEILPARVFVEPLEPSVSQKSLVKPTIRLPKGIYNQCVQFTSSDTMLPVRNVNRGQEASFVHEVNKHRNLGNKLPKTMPNSKEYSMFPSRLPPSPRDSNESFRTASPTQSTKSNVDVVSELSLFPAVHSQASIRSKSPFASPPQTPPWRSSVSQCSENAHDIATSIASNSSWNIQDIRSRSSHPLRMSPTTPPPPTIQLSENRHHLPIPSETFNAPDRRPSDTTTSLSSTTDDLNTVEDPQPGSYFSPNTPLPGSSFTALRKLAKKAMDRNNKLSREEKRIIATAERKYPAMASPTLHHPGKRLSLPGRRRSSIQEKFGEMYDTLVSLSPGNHSHQRRESAHSSIGFPSVYAWTPILPTTPAGTAFGGKSPRQLQLQQPELHNSPTSATQVAKSPTVWESESDGECPFPPSNAPKRGRPKQPAKPLTPYQMYGPKAWEMEAKAEKERARMAKRGHKHQRTVSGIGTRLGRNKLQKLRLSGGGAGSGKEEEEEAPYGAGALLAHSATAPDISALSSTGSSSPRKAPTPGRISRGQTSAATDELGPAAAPEVPRVRTRAVTLGSGGSSGIAQDVGPRTWLGKWRARKDEERAERWREELKRKIVIVGGQGATGRQPVSPAGAGFGDALGGRGWL